jgi:nucleoside-diphosphate-sugar epimerase
LFHSNKEEKKVHKNVKYAFFGAGYSLARAAVLLPNDEIVLVVRSDDSANNLKRTFKHVCVVDITAIDQLQNFFETFPRIQVLIDGIPPVHAAADPCCGVRSILATMPSSISRIFYLSTTGVFGAVNGEWVDETSVCSPIHSNGAARLESEKLYRNASCESKVILRLPAIYGPGRGTGMALKNGRYPYVENGSRWSNRIHVEDIAQVVALSSSFPGVLPEVLCVVDDEPALTSEIVGYYCSRFGFTMPESISLAEATRRGMQSLLSNQRVSNKLLKQKLGYQCVYPSYREGAGTEF